MTETESLFSLAEQYMYGRGVKCNYETAVDLYTQAAGAGSLDAMYKLAIIYRDGEIVKKDFEKALSYFKACADTGDNKSIFRLATIYTEGILCRPDAEKAFELYLMAAEKGYDKAQNNVATRYRKKGDYVKAVFWYEQAKNQGNESAGKNLYNLLNYNAHAMYTIGADLLEKDTARAMDLLSGAAKLNHIQAIELLAEIKVKNGEDAVKLYAFAASLGSCKSAEILGDYYFKTSLRTAEKYYKQASAQSATATKKLAACYTDSRRLFRRKSKAEKLINRLK